MLTKIKKTLYTISTGALFFPVVTIGQVNIGEVGIESELPQSTIAEVIINLMQWLLYIVGFVGIIAFVVSGIMYLTAAGDESKVEKAKNAMLYAIIGITVALAGLIVMTAISTWLGGGSVW